MVHKVLRLKPERLRVQRGFTIVELLIVVVVIAILAAITIVSYNGIQSRAKASVAQSNAKQASTKIQSYAIENSNQYPADPAVAGLVASSGLSYQYRVDNSGSEPTFCLTSTTQGVSYYVSNATATPTAGACPGHGVNGGEVITNLSKSPVPPASNILASGWYSSAGTGSGSISTSTSGGPVSGMRYARLTMTASGTTGSTVGILQGNGVSTGAAVTPGQTYRLSGWVRISDTNERGSINLRWKNSSGGTITPDAYAQAPANNGGWYWLSASAVAPANAAYIESRALVFDAVALSGTTLDGTGFMVTSGSNTYNYADGDSPGWAWNGGQYTSTSAGPPQ